MVQIIDPAPDLVDVEEPVGVSDEFAAALLEAREMAGDFGDEDFFALAELVVEFSQKLCGVDLYPYQKEAAMGMVFSVLREDAEEISMLFARQAGKTEVVGVVVIGLLVLLPVLARSFEAEEKLAKFKDGFHVGIFGPSDDIAGIMYRRMQARMYTDTAKEILEDPDIDMALPTRSQKMDLPNGSRVDCNTAAPGAKIEGQTYHLIVLEETQDISDYKIKKSIHPMGAATAATVVKIGTPVPRTCEFEQACKRNHRRDLEGKSRWAEIRFHYEFDYTVAMRYNPRYAKYMVKEVARLGEDSDEFRMSYKLHWLADRGHFLPAGLFEECAVTVRDVLEARIPGRDRLAKGEVTKFVRPSYPTTNDRSSHGQVAAVDFGKEHNSTVVTVGRVWWDNPITLQTFDGDEQDRFYVHIQNWLEIVGDNYDAQVPQIVAFLQNFDISMLVCDSTGPGDPVTDFLANALENTDIIVEPFVFTTPSKDVGYKMLLQEMQAGRLSYPAGSRATKTRKFQKFRQQLQELEKSWRAARMVVACPKGDKNAHDDYPDSLMMLVYGVVEYAENERDVETDYNPFIGRQARQGSDIFGSRLRSFAKRHVRMQDKLNG